MPPSNPSNSEEFTPEPASISSILSEYLKEPDSHASGPESVKPKSKISDYTFDSGIINPSGGFATSIIGKEQDEADSVPVEENIDTDDGDTANDAAVVNVKEGFPDVAGYVILKELGRGGMGVVYKARQIQLNRVVALKTILHHGYLTQESISRFKTEAEALARVAHPGIVQVYEIGEFNGQAYFTLEYCGGGSLSRELKKGPFPFKVAAETIEGLSRAVHFAHEARIIHRDLKPGNILRTTKGEYKITDFGLAKKMDVDEKLTQSGAIIGTPGYMAPEQAAGEVNKLGPPCDIYALGAMLYECVTGRTPFKSMNAMDAVIQVVTMEPVAPSRLEPKTPKDLETIILKCLHKTPERRYTTAADLADDLRRFIRGEPIIGRPASVWERTWKWTRKHPATAASMAFIFLGIFAFLGFTVWQSKQIGIRNAELTIAVNDALERERTEQAAKEAEKAEKLALQKSLDDEIAARKLAEAAQKDRNDAELFLVRAREAEKSRNWESMRVSAERIAALAGDRKEFAEMNAEAKALIARSTEYVENQKKIEGLEKCRDDVRTIISPFSNIDPTQKTKLALAEIDRGLAIFGLAPDRDGPIAFSTLYSADEKLDIARRCYELLLIRADEASLKSDGDAEDTIRKKARDGMALLDRAATVLEPEASLYLRKARLALQAGEAELAGDLARKAETVQPKSAFDYYLRGETEYQLNRIANAKAAFSESMRLNPSDFWTQYFLALSAIRGTPPRPNEAIAFLNLSSIKKPNFCSIYNLRGLAHNMTNEFALAESDFEKALELTTDPTIRYGILINRAIGRSQTKNVTGAEEDLEAAIKLRDTEFGAHQALALLRSKTDPAKALTSIERAIAIQPKRGDLFALRADIQYRNNRPAEAVADLDRALALETDGSAAALTHRLTKAKWLVEMKKFDQAIAASDAVLAMNPTNRDKAFVEASQFKIRSLVELRKYDEALKACAVAEKHGWKPDAEELRFRGLARAKVGQSAEAIADLSQAIDQKPTALAYSERGWIYLKLSAHKLALNDFQASIDKGETADALSGRGFARIATGDVALALNDANRSVEMAGTAPRVLFNAARIHVIAANRLPEQDRTKTTNPLTAKSRAEYLERAVDLLGQTFLAVPAEQHAALWSDIAKDDTIKALEKWPSYAKMSERFTSRQK